MERPDRPEKMTLASMVYGVIELTDAAKEALTALEAQRQGHTAPARRLAEALRRIRGIENYSPRRETA
jgi:hypothetical protein